MSLAYQSGDGTVVNQFMNVVQGRKDGNGSVKSMIYQDTTTPGAYKVFYQSRMAQYKMGESVRRFGLLRMKVDDVQESRLLVRERKRIRGEMSSRFVPLTRELQSILSTWFTIHPGSEFLFARESIEGVSKDVAHKHLTSS